VPSSSLALAVFNFGSVVGTSAAGWLVSRFGGAIVLPASMLGAVVAYGLIGHAAPDATMIAVLEGFVGLFLGCSSSALIALSAIFYPSPNPFDWRRLGDGDGALWILRRASGSGRAS
jgi:AAHS family 4-hydroxybenzoate transporter-like MFS transporter